MLLASRTSAEPFFLFAINATLLTQGFAGSTTPSNRLILLLLCSCFNGATCLGSFSIADTFFLFFFFTFSRVHSSYPLWRTGTDPAFHHLKFAFHHLKFRSC